MNREVHGRFCESLGVKLPRATRHLVACEMVARVFAKASKWREFEPSPAFAEDSKRARQARHQHAPRAAQARRYRTETLAQVACLA